MLDLLDVEYKPMQTLRLRSEAAEVAVGPLYTMEVDEAALRVRRVRAGEVEAVYDWAWILMLPGHRLYMAVVRMRQFRPTRFDARGAAFGRRDSRWRNGDWTKGSQSRSRVSP
jgi:hypothetical protein